MKTRKDLLLDLISLSGPIDQILADLSSFGYDTKVSPMIIRYEDLLRILEKTVKEGNEFDLLEKWADAVEIRDDIDFVDDELKELIFELANPALNGPITRDRVIEMIGICKAPNI